MNDADWNEYQRRWEETKKHIDESLKKSGERLDKLLARQQRDDERFRRAAKAFLKAWNEEEPPKN